MMHTYARTVIWTLIGMAMTALPACTGGLPVAPQDATQVTDILGLLQNDAGPLAETPETQNDCVVVGDPATAVHRRLFRALNRYREERGLNPLVYSKRLEEAADAHLKDLHDRNYFAHITPDGLNPGDRAMAAGFCHQYVGENLAAGQRSVPAVMRAWDESPAHQENMVEPDYVYAGVGHFYDAETGRQYWAQEFAYDLQ
jgi:uncharacterized protein YkwD